MASLDQIGQAENISEQEVELRRIVNLTPQMLYVLEPDGRISQVNDVALDYLGVSLEDLRREDFLARIIHPDDLPKTADRRAALAAGTPFETEPRLRGKDGKYRWFLLRYNPWKDAEGRVLRWYGAATDIEERKRAEEALRRSEQVFRDAIDTIPVYAWSALPDGSIDFMNQRTLEVTGLSREKVLGWQWRSALHPDDVIGFVEKWRIALRVGEPMEGEARLRYADGTYHWWLIRDVPLRDELGNIVKWYGTGVDIQDRKQAEEALRRSEAYLAEAQSLSKTGSWVWSPQAGKLIHWSEELFRITGFDPKEGLPDPGSLWQRIHPDDRIEAAERRQKAVHDKTEYTHDYRIVLPDGTIKHLHVIGHPMPNDAGDAVEFIGTTIDVTERKRAEAELRQLIDAIPQQVFVFDSDWSPLFANSQEREYTGLTTQEAKSKDAVGKLFHPDDLKKLEIIRKRARSDGTPCEMEARIRGKDGQYRWFLIRDNPLRDEQGRVIRWYGTRTDIQDRKEAEQALHQAQAELERVNRIMVMGEMAASIAHEINQPLTGVVAHAGTCLRWLAAQPPDVEEARQYLGLIVRDGNRAADVIRGVRAFVKKVPPRRDRLDINEVVREVIALTHNELQRKSVRLHPDLASDLPLVAADRVQLQQVILNLIVNAMEAMAGVRDRPLEIVVASGTGDSNDVFVEVRDSGPGFAPANLSRLFDSFYTTKPDGMGMGLSISRSIIEAHGGRLWATANQPHGAVFRFTLPVEAGASS